MKDPMSELKPCPFCGGAANIRKGREPQMHCVVWEIACKRCNMSPSSPCVSAVGVSEKEVTEKWNTRAPDAGMVEALRECAEACRTLLRITGDIEVLGEWSALEMNRNLQKTTRAKVDAVIATAEAAIAKANEVLNRRAP